MATMTKTTKRVKPVRSATVFHLNNGKPVLCLMVNGVQTTYLLTPIASDFGAAFHLTKSIGPDGIGGEKYDVLLHGKESSCTCPGNTYHGHCKHLDAITALVQSGKLAVHEPAPVPEPEEEDGWEATEQPPQPIELEDL